MPSFQLISHLSVLENVEMPLFYAREPKRRRHRRCRELIERVGLSHRIEHLPSELSGGENQRAAIARAMANDPAIILADEPTGNLDSQTSKEIMDLIRKLQPRWQSTFDRSSQSWASGSVQHPMKRRQQATAGMDSADRSDCELI